MNFAGISIVNVQSGVSHLGRFDNANAHSFEDFENRKYFDVTRLKKKGR